MVQNTMFASGNVSVKAQLGNMQVVEYARDMSVSKLSAKTEYYCAKMNVNRRQLLLNLNGNGFTVQAGAMQWMAGNVNMQTGVKGAGDFLGKMIGAKVSGETTVKPIYEGYGQLMLEPTYRHIILTDLAEWGGSVVLDDGLFLACDNTVQQKIVGRKNVSSAVLGGEGLFNLSLNGQGICALESIVPREEIFEIILQDDVMKIDGNMAIAWSSTLDFTVEKSTKSLIGSAVSGEGFVNVYRGSGKIWMAPVMAQSIVSNGSAGQTNLTENASTGQTGSKAAKSGVMDKIDKISNFVDLFS